MRYIQRPDWRPENFKGIFKTLRVFAPSSSEFIPFLTCHLDSSPGFDPFATPFIKKAERHYRDGLDKLRKENVLLSTLTDLFHLLLSSGVLPFSLMHAGAGRGDIFP